MSRLYPLAMATALLSLFGGGCCSLPTHCGSPAVGGPTACGTGVPISETGCATCGDVSRAAHGRCGLLGLGKLAHLFDMSTYGVACGGGGCGEVYWHDWISDPPCSDPCDNCGNWTGPVPHGDAVGYHGPGLLDAPLLTPACSGGCFRGPGRFLYSSWLGVGGFLHHLKRGLLPYHFGCHGGCTSCPVPVGGCDDCVSVNGPWPAQASVNDLLVEASPPPAISGPQLTPPRRPTQVVVKPYRRPLPEHPPHPVVAERLR